MSTQKKWEDLELKDDFMFAKVMRDPKLCREMLERLLEIEIASSNIRRNRKPLTYLMTAAASGLTCT